MQNLYENVNRFIDSCQYMKGLSDKTIKAYTNDLNQFIKWNSNNPDWYSKSVLEGYIKQLYEEYKPRSAKRKIACLKAFFHHLELEEEIPSSPFHKIKFKRREPITLPKSIPIQVISEIFNTVYCMAESDDISAYKKKNTIRDIAVLELLFASGMRIGELCNLQPSDVDLKDKIVKVIGKGSKERYIQITNKSVLSALNTYKKTFSDEINNCNYFFCNNRGNRLSEQSARLMIEKYAKLSGTDKHITPHMFRHSVATLLIEEGVDIRYIQELLGHSSITTTQIYTHISLSAQKKILTQKHPRNKIKISKQ